MICGNVDATKPDLTPGLPSKLQRRIELFVQSVSQNSHLLQLSNLDFRLFQRHARII